MKLAQSQQFTKELKFKPNLSSVYSNNEEFHSEITVLNEPDSTEVLQTFVFSLLPLEEKKRFMDFLIDNNVEFKQDENDGGYTATVRILNQQVTSKQHIINGMEEMR